MLKNVLHQCSYILLILQSCYSGLLSLAAHCSKIVKRKIILYSPCVSFLQTFTTLSLLSHFLHSFIGFSPLFFHSFSLVLSISSSLQPSRPCPLLLFPLSLSPFSHGCETLWVTWSRWVVGHNLGVDRIWWQVKFCDGQVCVCDGGCFLICDLVAGFCDGWVLVFVL